LLAYRLASWLFAVLVLTRFVDNLILKIEATVDPSGGNAYVNETLAALA